MRRDRIVGLGLAGVLVLGALVAGESERRVKESEVPRPALEALKKVAGTATLREFSEEVEHGHKFYEGSWSGAQGNVDALVTDAGDLVEVEEIVPGDQAPAAVRSAAEHAAGKETRVTFEKKTLVLYEIHFRQGGHVHEMIFTPDGRRYHEEGEEHDAEKEEEEEEG
jgi:hypothetical protein